MLLKCSGDILNNEFFLCRGENETVENIAAAVVAGRAKLDYVSAPAGAGLPLPARECPTCEGTVWLINWPNHLLFTIYLL